MRHISLEEARLRLRNAALEFAAVTDSMNKTGQPVDKDAYLNACYKLEMAAREFCPPNPNRPFKIPLKYHPDLGPRQIRH